MEEKAMILSPQRRCSRNCVNKFVRPLIVYKISSDAALEETKKAIKYLLLNPCIEKVYYEAEYSDKFTDLYTMLELKDVINKLSGFDNDADSDLCVTIGGDGTVLWANYLYGLRTRPPFVTFNMGTLGYLAYYKNTLIVEILTILVENKETKLIFEKRSTLEFNKITKKEIEQHKGDPTYAGKAGDGIALNDIVINRDSLRAVILDIYLNNLYMTTIRSDGIIVSSSTGSTAYSLSSGGSIVHYDVDCLLMSAICPHSLSFRPIVFPKQLRLQIILNENSPSKAHYCNDGIYKYMMDYSEGVEVSVSSNYLNIIILEKYLKCPLSLWIDKMTEQLGWNNAFKIIV